LAFFLNQPYEPDLAYCFIGGHNWHTGWAGSLVGAALDDRRTAGAGAATAAAPDLGAGVHTTAYGAACPHGRRRSADTQNHYPHAAAAYGDSHPAASRISHPAAHKRTDNAGHADSHAYTLGYPFATVRAPV